MKNKRTIHKIKGESMNFATIDLFSWSERYNLRKWAIFLIVLVFLIIGGFGLQAQTNIVVKSVKATVSGTSTLYDWESEITKMEFKGVAHIEGNSLKYIKKAEVKIPVVGIVSTEGKTMDTKTYQTFKYTKHPFIIYTFSNARITDEDTRNIRIETYGDLSMAGVTKHITIIGNGELLANGNLHFVVQHKMKISDFGMKPPTLFLGSIKVGDEITDNFNIEIEQSK